MIFVDLTSHTSNLIIDHPSYPPTSILPNNPTTPPPPPNPHPYTHQTCPLVCMFLSWSITHKEINPPGMFSSSSMAAGQKSIRATGQQGIKAEGQQSSMYGRRSRDQSPGRRLKYLEFWTFCFKSYISNMIIFKNTFGFLNSKYI